MRVLPLPHIPVPWGELIDKITILEIKTERLPDPAARARALAELDLLRKSAEPALGLPMAAALTAQLKEVNASLWEIEDRIRDHERRSDFGASFVELARSVYKRNDERGALKRQISLALGSELMEEKGYQPY